MNGETFEPVVPTESTAKYLETKQASTTIPCGCDNADDIKVVKSILVNSYNAVSCSLRSYILRLSCNGIMHP